jgi:hypothetical protein
MHVLLWCANVLLAVVSTLALVHVGTVVNGAGTGVRVMTLQVDGVLDYEKAREKYPQWRDHDLFESMGRHIAKHHIDAEGLLAGLGLTAAVINMFGLASKRV